MKHLSAVLFVTVCALTAISLWISAAQGAGPGNILDDPGGGGYVCSWPQYWSPGVVWFRSQLTPGFDIQFVCGNWGWGYCFASSGQIRAHVVGTPSITQAWPFC